MTPARRGATAARAAVALGVLVTSLLALLLQAAPAQATTYRYWTYWWVFPSASSWTYASLGPASDRPKDESVVGWRFATTTDGGGKKTPRATASYASLCPSQAASSAPAGKNRVAVVVDYGTTSDAPPGQTPPLSTSVYLRCVSITSGANGFAALAAASVTPSVRNDGIVCSLDGYPKDECVAAVADSTPTPTPSPSRTTTTNTPSATAAVGVTVRTPTASRPAAAAPTSSAAASITPTTRATSSEPTAAATSAAAPSGSSDVLPVSAQAPTSQQSGSSPIGLGIGLVVVVVLGGAAWWTTRGRSS